MATGLFDKGRNAFAKGDIHWKASGGDTIRCFLVDTGVDTPNLATDDFLDDILVGALGGPNGNTGYNQGAQLTLLDPVDGICDAENTTLTAVPTGGPYEGILLYKQGTSSADSPLLAYIDNATGLPVTTNGGDVTIQWSDLTNKIFKL